MFGSSGVTAPGGPFTSCLLYLGSGGYDAIQIERSHATEMRQPESPDPNLWLETAVRAANGQPTAAKS